MSASASAPTGSKKANSCKFKIPVNQPPPIDMVKASINAAKDREGTSLPTIKEFIAANYNFETWPAHPSGHRSRRRESCPRSRRDFNQIISATLVSCCERTRNVSQECKIPIAWLVPSNPAPMMLPRLMMERLPSNCQARRTDQKPSSAPELPTFHNTANIDCSPRKPMPLDGTLDGENSGNSEVTSGSTKEFQCDLVPLDAAKSLNGTWKATVDPTEAASVTTLEADNSVKIGPPDVQGYRDQPSSFNVSCTFSTPEGVALYNFERTVTVKRKRYLNLLTQHESQSSDCLEKGELMFHVTCRGVNTHLQKQNLVLRLESVGIALRIGIVPHQSGPCVFLQSALPTESMFLLSVTINDKYANND
ncbi:hypothetical protein T265_12027 [Opisthorchis viverrini]|uniref:H15 domain-containing protein n=1 Tax=Opisthorchis viverrini TaxID=6198 RepID=A0A074YWB6_OPIVI|nr:hypothetical protein T265_12027 [Opisthorchis viverrini]KER19066.1 hypothetical protein T265_12027 [Opisthorchis viverrini]